MSRPNILTPAFIASMSIPVPESGCWLWTGYVRPDGYGHLRSYNKKILAHRASYSAHFEMPPDDILVCHKCDTRSCVNPKHLFLGTTQDNVDDRNSKGRTAVALANGRAKLSDEQVLYIRASSDTRKQLAHRFNVSVDYISKLRSGSVRSV